MEDEGERPDLGTCCNCTAFPATAIMMLNRRAPVPGTGWGCVVCDLPCDGAVAAVCDDCADALAVAEAPPRFVCVGYPSAGKRTGYFEIDAKPDAIFEHDPAKHMDDGV